MQKNIFYYIEDLVVNISPYNSLVILILIKVFRRNSTKHIKTNVESCVFLNILLLFALSVLRTGALHKLSTLIFIKEPPAVMKYMFNYYSKISNAIVDAICIEFVLWNLRHISISHKKERRK